MVRLKHTHTYTHTPSSRVLAVCTALQNFRGAAAMNVLKIFNLQIEALQIQAETSEVASLVITRGEYGKIAYSLSMSVPNFRPPYN